MIIKHYLNNSLCLIEGVSNIWVHGEDRESISKDNDFFAYTKEELDSMHKIVFFDDMNGNPKTLRVHSDVTVYICNDDGKTIEKVSF